MTARARLLSVVVIVIAGALGVISSTQTWLVVSLAQGGDHHLEVPGASAVPVLAPLSLAVLALGVALAIAGTVLRYVFGALTVLIAGALGWLTAAVAFEHPTGAVAAVVTEATGITGESAIEGLVASITATAWPVITLVVCVLLLGAGVFVLASARLWHGSGRRFRTDDAHAAPGAADAADAPTTARNSRPHDAIDSWDDLSRGEDPTT